MVTGSLFWGKNANNHPIFEYKIAKILLERMEKEHRNGALLC
jgi:hypothetical protein